MRGPHLLQLIDQVRTTLCWCSWAPTQLTTMACGCYQLLEAVLCCRNCSDAGLRDKHQGCGLLSSACRALQLRLAVQEVTRQALCRCAPVLELSAHLVVARLRALQLVAEVRPALAGGCKGGLQVPQLIAEACILLCGGCQGALQTPKLRLQGLHLLLPLVQGGAKILGSRLLILKLRCQLLLLLHELSPALGRGGQSALQLLNLCCQLLLLIHKVSAALS